MNIAELAIRKKTITIVLMVLFLVGGWQAYNKMGRLEDPEFTIKEAVIMTPYPGASAAEVEEEVTNVIEMACQQLGQLRKVRSWSYRGLSVVKPEIKKKYDKHTLPQIWDELRRKINDVQGQLPPGAGPSLVNDDFGDVYGVFYAITGDGYSLKDIQDYAELLQRELLQVQDVKKIVLYGVQNEMIYVEISREKLSQMGITEDEIFTALKEKNLVSDAGYVEVGTDYIAIEPTGIFTSEQQFGELLISSSSNSGRQIFLKDVATIRRGYIDPPTTKLRYDGKTAVGLGISTVSGGNVVTMGEGLKKRFEELEPLRPAGMELNIVSFQPDAVTTSIDGFVVSLLQAVAIVIVVLLIFMGMRSGFIIGYILVLTIIGSFIFISMTDTMLERISLGALIIALGMLVDNAIVVTEGMLIKIQNGVDRIKAARDVVKQVAIPLLGATFIAVMAFGPIGLSEDSTGEYCGSLFTVLLISLLVSWLTAVTATPLCCYFFIKVKKTEGEQTDPYAGGFYAVYKKFLRTCIKHRWITIGVVVGLFMVSLFCFKFINNSFFPDSTRPQFMVDVWLPEGTHINETERVIAAIEKDIMSREGVAHVSSCVGGGALRFLLTYAPEVNNSSYGQLLVDVDDYRVINRIELEVQNYLIEHYPDTITNVKKFLLGPGEGGKIQLRLSGPDPAVVREYADQAMAIMYEDGGAKSIRHDWREKVKLVRPVLAEQQARQAGIERPDIAQALKQGFEGRQVGVYREGRKLISILSRAPENERTDIKYMQELQVWSPVANTMIPIRQVVSRFDTGFEDSTLARRNRKSTITIHCDALKGLPSVLLERIMPKIEALELPEGYLFEWGGEYESSGEAQEAIKGNLPLFFTLMVLTVIILFNSIRKTLVIWFCVPLALIGVAWGLLLTGQPLGFMSILGILSLSGMLIKNAIVLVDEINLQLSEGKEPLTAIIDSGVSRMRPVMMAAATTVLGMAPLLGDAFFISMAVTIMFGLTFASVLTLVILPVFYATLFKVKYVEENE